LHHRRLTASSNDHTPLQASLPFATLAPPGNALATPSTTTNPAIALRFVRPLVFALARVCLTTAPQFVHLQQNASGEKPHTKALIT
ncbi:hypothetical protein BOTBODRAFT_161275, partial [Botryobasidium botryosum FD-172 SS1]